MKRTSLDEMNCSVARTLDVVGDAWTLLIVRDALFDPVRFDDVQQRLGVPRTTLANRLATLVEHGVLERREYRSAPVRHEYVITDKGLALHPVVVAMLQWGDEWSTIERPPVTLVDERTGEEIDPVYIDRRTGERLQDLSIARRHNG